MTTNPTTAPTPTSGRPAATDELARWRAVGRRLWPYVRYFGLCGADLEAVESVAELATLLGLNGPAGPLAQEAIEQTRQQAIEDALHGITGEDALERIFERFYRVDNRLRRETQGVGLGLFLARAIVEAHHGAIAVDSAPGQGVTVSGAVPVEPAETSSVG